ncbi:hypothetical protein ACF0H5_008470 [Mactra antiquata]
MAMLWFWILSVLALTEGIDRTKLWTVPKPMNGLNPQGLLGHWFVQYRISPHSWPGSDELTDYEINLTHAGKNTMMMTLTMRKDVCNTIHAKMYIKPGGVMTLTDPIGNAFSGLVVIPKVYYDSFCIFYICTRMNVQGKKCDDALVSIETRMPLPNKDVIARINQALISLWGTTVDQLTPVRRKQSCLAETHMFPPRAKWG